MEQSNFLREVIIYGMVEEFSAINDMHNSYFSLFNSFFAMNQKLLLQLLHYLYIKHCCPRQPHQISLKKFIKFLHFRGIVGIFQNLF